MQISQQLSKALFAATEYRGDHVRLEGKVWDYGTQKFVWYTELAAEYPEDLCRAMASAYAQALRESPPLAPPPHRIARSRPDPSTVHARGISWRMQ